MADSDIVVTEIMYDAPNSVQDNDYEWVEIANTGTDPVSLDGWTLDDSRTNNANVGVIPDVTLAAGDIAILYNDNITEAEFIALYNPAPGTVLIPVASWQALNNSNGDTVNLFNAQDELVTSVSYNDDASAGQSLNYATTGTYEGAGAPDPGIVCFTAGSLVACADGQKPVETLKPGDKVRTLDHGLQKLRWVGVRHVSQEEQVRNPDFCPVQIRQSALGDGVPTRDTQVSQQHRLLIESADADLLFGHERLLCAAEGLVNGESVRLMPPAPVTYYHLLFDHHEILTVDGMPSESFHPTASGTSALSAKTRAELSALFPNMAQMPDMPIAYPALNRAEVALLQL